MKISLQQLSVYGVISDSFPAYQLGKGSGYANSSTDNPSKVAVLRRMVYPVVSDFVAFFIPIEQNILDLTRPFSLHNCR